jgi:phosphoserine phosphatase RsbX
VDHLTTPLVEWAVASRPLEAGVSGDAYIVHPLPGGALFGVVDGAGHGPAAAHSANEAIRALAADATHPLIALAKCHERLRASRGVVLMLAWVDSQSDSMAWIGIGTAQGVLLRGDPGSRPREHVLVGRVGVVGRQLPPLQARTITIAPGDVLVLATDGIHASFMNPAPRSGVPQRLADDILARHWGGTDDGLVLVVRYQGASS